MSNTNNINNWQELVKAISIRKDDQRFSAVHCSSGTGAFPKLLIKINKYLSTIKNNNALQFLNKTQLDTFNNFKIIYEQLLLEDDIIDIHVTIPSLDDTNSLFFNMVGIGKWIKFHSGNVSRIFFIDEEKTMISDKTISDFVNKLASVSNGYLYFSQKPIVYYKFVSLPSDDIVNYFKKYDITVLTIDQKTDPIYRPKCNRVLLDQSVMLNLCCDSSYELSQLLNESTLVPLEQLTDSMLKNKPETELKNKPETELKNKPETELKNKPEIEIKNKPEIKNKLQLKNKQDLDEFMEGYEIIANQTVFDQTRMRIWHSGGPVEKQHFAEFEKRLTIVPDCINPRFRNMNQHEIITMSVAEKENAIIMTTNQRFCNKLDINYKEIPYKLFTGQRFGAGDCFLETSLRFGAEQKFN